MIKPVVIHISRAPVGWEGDPTYVYIGRAGRGHDGYFGNPCGTGVCPVCSEIHIRRGTSLECYEIHLKERILSDPGFRSRLKGLVNKVLVCFCKPNKCHGDILAAYAMHGA